MPTPSTPKSDTETFIWEDDAINFYRLIDGLQILVQSASFYRWSEHFILAVVHEHLKDRHEIFMLEDGDFDVENDNHARFMASIPFSEAVDALIAGDITHRYRVLESTYEWDGNPGVTYTYGMSFDRLFTFGDVMEGLPEPIAEIARKTQRAILLTLSQHQQHHHYLERLADFLEEPPDQKRTRTSATPLSLSIKGNLS